MCTYVYVYVYECMYACVCGWAYVCVWACVITGVCGRVCGRLCVINYIYTTIFILIEIKKYYTLNIGSILTKLRKNTNK